MIDDRSKSSEVVGTLIKLTQQGKLEWNEIDPPTSFSRGKDRIIDFAYLAEYRNRKLIIYQERKQNIYRDITGEILTSWSNPNVVLEIIDESFKVLWTFPLLRSLDDLVYSIRFKLGGIKDFFDEVLGEN